MKKLLIVAYFLSAIVCGGFTGIGSVVFYKIAAPGNVVTITERPPAPLYKELFITQAVSWAETLHTDTLGLKVSEILALAATRSGFGHSPSDPGDAVVNILGETSISELEREVIKELNLTQYDK